MRYQPLMTTRRALLLAAGFLAAAPLASLAAEEQPTLGLGEAVSGLFKQAQVSGQLMTVWSKIRAGDPGPVPELRKMAQAGDPHAQLFYGYLLDNGMHLQANSKQAAAYFAAAAEKVPLAKYNLGLLLLLGRGVAKDEPRAMRLFDEVLKVQQIEQATVRLAQFHMRERRYADAKRYAEMGANFSNRYCHLLLAQIYYAQQDYRSAYHWGQKALTTGMSDAGLILANLYGNGQISKPSNLMATGWDLVYRSGRSNWASPMTMSPGVWASDLSQSDLDRARAMANDWVVGASKFVDPTPYSKTIYDTRTWRGA